METVLLRQAIPEAPSAATIMLRTYLTEVAQPSEYLCLRRIKGVPVFRTKESYVSVYCTDIFKKAVEDAQLEGLLFSENLTHL